MENDIGFLVRVNCMTYNQSSYIEDAMNGFCIQQTNFPFLCVIVDDASTDGEPEVIMKYLDDNFDRIIIELSTEDETDEYIRIFARHKENNNCFFCVLLLKYNHSSAKKAKLTNIEGLINPIKYIALCEGDDYWTDPLKLQKQVEFLDANEDYVLSFHDAKIVDADKNIIAESKIERYYTREMCRDWSEYELMCGYAPPTPTVIYRSDTYRKVLSERSKHSAKNIVNGDTVVASIIGKYGKAKFHDDIANSVCRVHSGGVWQNKSDLYKNQSHYNLYTFLQRIHKRNKYVNEHMNNTRFNIVKRIIRISIAEKEKRIFFKYYVILWMLMLKKFNMKTMYVVNRDIVHWIRLRNVK